MGKLSKYFENIFKVGWRDSIITPVRTSEFAGGCCYKGRWQSAGRRPADATSETHYNTLAHEDQLKLKTAHFEQSTRWVWFVKVKGTGTEGCRNTPNDLALCLMRPLTVHQRSNFVANQPFHTSKKKLTKNWVSKKKTWKNWSSCALCACYSGFRKSRQLETEIFGISNEISGKHTEIWVGTAVACRLVGRVGRFKSWFFWCFWFFCFLTICVHIYPLHTLW